MAIELKVSPKRYTYLSFNPIALTISNTASRYARKMITLSNFLVSPTPKRYTYLSFNPIALTISNTASRYARERITLSNFLVSPTPKRYTYLSFAPINLTVEYNQYYRGSPPSVVSVVAYGYGI